ncbi:hypothetical protein Tco_0420917 [Tanacetum coccineum]
MYETCALRKQSTVRLTVGLSPTIILRRENEELREFTSEYYIPFALHLVVPAASASIADFPEGKVVGSLPRDEHEELREFTSEYYIPFALHPVVPAASASIADFPEGKVGKWICLACSFRVRPKLVTEGCLPLKMVEPLFGKYCRATVGTCAGASELKYLDDISRRDGTVPRRLMGMPCSAYGRSLIRVTCAASRAGGAAESKVFCTEACEEKMALLVKVEQERANSADYKASCHWAVKTVGEAEVKLRKLSIEYDEELYPHMLSAMLSQCALARGKAEAVEELHEKKLLTVPAAQVPGYNDNAYEELVAAMETMKLLELPHIAQLERDQDYPIDVIMAGLTLARHATEGAEAQPDYFLKPDMAQLQRTSPSMESQLDVRLCAPKDSEHQGKLEEACDAAYQCGIQSKALSPPHASRLSSMCKLIGGVCVC